MTFLLLFLVYELLKPGTVVAVRMRVTQRIQASSRFKISS